MKTKRFEPDNKLLIVPLVLGVLAAGAALFRELWFDEALTVTNFMLPYSLGEIYAHYTIPNNQIVYTMLLKVWENALDWGVVDAVFLWRVLSLACSLGMLAILWNLRRKLDAGRVAPALLSLAAFVLSCVWANYATAIRGYAASWLWITVALCGAHQIFCGNAKRGWCVYSLGSLLAVGTIPTNLLALGGVVCYAISWSKRDFWHDTRVWLMAVVPFAALAVFYAPIAGAFLKTFHLGEGFGSRWGALAVTAGMVLTSFGAMLFYMPRPEDTKDVRGWFKIAVFLLPVPAIFCLHQAPFPRVFITLAPVMLMVLGDGLAKVHDDWNRTRWIKVIISVVLLRFAAPYAAKLCHLSPYEDDFFAPWYMAKTYAVTPTVAELKTLAPNPVYVSFNADPVPVIFYAAMAGTKQELRADVPYGSVKSLPSGSYCILRNDENPAETEKRFGCKLKCISDTKQHSIYRVERQP